MALNHVDVGRIRGGFIFFFWCNAEAVGPVEVICVHWYEFRDRKFRERSGEIETEQTLAHGNVRINDDLGHEIFDAPLGHEVNVNVSDVDDDVGVSQIGTGTDNFLDFVFKMLEQYSGIFFELICFVLRLLRSDHDLVEELHGCDILDRI